MDDLRPTCRLTACTLGISSGPNARYRVWEAFTFTFLIKQSKKITKYSTTDNRTIQQSTLHCSAVQWSEWQESQLS